MKTLIVLPSIAMFLRAMDHYALTEIAGKDNNPQIVQFFEDIGHDWVQDDETAWCSCFINWLAWKEGIERSNELNARSWLTVGTKTDKPKLGDVVVFWRESHDSWKGHVGLYVKDTFSLIYVLGGNQDNMVNIKPYPKYQLLGYRQLSYLP